MVIIDVLFSVGVGLFIGCFASKVILDIKNRRKRKNEKEN